MTHTHTHTKTFSIIPLILLLITNSHASQNTAPSNYLSIYRLRICCCCCCCTYINWHKSAPCPIVYPTKGWKISNKMHQIMENGWRRWWMISWACPGKEAVASEDAEYKQTKRHLVQKNERSVSGDPQGIIMGPLLFLRKKKLFECLLCEWHCV